VAGGYAAGSAAQQGKFLINAVYAPSTVTTAETFLWYNATPDVRIGLAHLWEQNAFRALAAVRLRKETPNAPALHMNAGVQGIGTGNPGFSATAEKNFAQSAGNLNFYAGIGYRSNEDHVHGLAGIKFQFKNNVTLGVQHEGHAAHPFVTYGYERYIFGVYLIEGKSPAYMIGARF